MDLRPETYNIIELCAGVGGLGLGIHIAEPRARSIAHVEREAYAAATLAARMEAGELAPAPIWSDLGTFDGRRWRGYVHCIASGDPCQPNSVAGNRLGADDERFLIDQVLRVFDESGADRLFRENVTGNADGQLAALVPALERMGCRVAAGIFSAAEVGASHRRERLFIMADREGRGRGERGDEAQSRRGGHIDRGDAQLADSDGVGRQHAGLDAGSAGAGSRARRGKGRAEPREVGGDVANAGSGAGSTEHEYEHGERAGEPGRSGRASPEAMANGNGSGLGSERQSEPRGIGSTFGDVADGRGGARATVEHAERAEWRPEAGERDGEGSHGVEAGRIESADGLGSAGVGMADAAVRGRQTWQHVLAIAGFGLSGSGRPSLVIDPSRHLADAEGAGSQGQRNGDGPAGWADADGSVGLGGGTLELVFAPGPTDGRWPAIIDAWPGLEPSLCRNADGLAHRVDRLRACGNGVVSLAAAYAWVTLGALLEATRPAR